MLLHSLGLLRQGQRAPADGLRLILRGTAAASIGDTRSAWHFVSAEILQEFTECNSKCRSDIKFSSKTWQARVNVCEAEPALRLKALSLVVDLTSCLQWFGGWPQAAPANLPCRCGAMKLGFAAVLE